MKIQEIIVSPLGLIGNLPSPNRGSIRLWVPSRWINISTFSWPGRLHRYHVWQRIGENAIQPPFNFEQAFDFTQKNTEVSVMQMPAEKWAQLPIFPHQVDYLTAPNIMAHHFLPKKVGAFALLAYRWLGRLELCGFRFGLLQHALQGDVSAEGAWGVWSRMIQAMPVLGAAPLYCTEESLALLFQAHHPGCHVLSSQRSGIKVLFDEMRDAHEFTD